MSSRNRRTAPAYVVPDLSGRRALVTGANSGIGYWTALQLAQAGAAVTLGCRSPERAEAALADLRAAVPTGSFDVVRLDLADGAAVRTAAEEFGRRYDRLDLLVNNAGIALVPFELSVDGHENHLAANFLGHFALTGLLIDQITSTPGSRVVQVGSLAHRSGRLDFEDPHFERRPFTKWRGYAQSKLANQVFMIELERRLRRGTSDTISVGGHPGSSFTGIADEMRIIKVPGIRTAARWLEGKALNVPELGALPSVRAATEPGLPGGTYFGPSQLFEVKGPAAPAKISQRALDEADGRRLWDLAQRLTGVSYLD